MSRPSANGITGVSGRSPACQRTSPTSPTLTLGPNLASRSRTHSEKLRRLAALPDGRAATLPATVDYWRRCEQNLAILTHTDNLAITPLLAEVPGVPCPYCGVYFQHTKAMRQHTARRHGINWKEPLQIAYDPSLHATKGMPECRHCGKRCGSHQGLKFHIMHNACGWYQTQDTEGSALPAQPEAGQRDSAPASPYAPQRRGRPLLLTRGYRNYRAM